MGGGAAGGGRGLAGNPLPQMTTLPQIIVDLNTAADRTVDLALAENLRRASEDIERAVTGYDPTLGDFPAWLRGMTSALMHAQRLHIDVTGRVLVVTQDVAPNDVPPPPPRPLLLDRKLMSSAPLPGGSGDAA